MTEKFALGKVHVDAPLSADVGSVAVRWIRRFYLGMIVTVIGGMLLHNFIIWRSESCGAAQAAESLCDAHDARFSAGSTLRC